MSTFRACRERTNPRAEARLFVMGRRRPVFYALLCAFIGGSPAKSLPGRAMSTDFVRRRCPPIIENEAAGTRTQDLRIKSPLLYRLSYNLFAS